MKDSSPKLELRKMNTRLAGKRDELQGMFSDIKVSTFELLMDPWIECLMYPCYCMMGYCMKVGKSRHARRMEVVE